MTNYYSGLYKSYFTAIRLPDKAFDFSSMNMSRLEKKNYDGELIRRLKETKDVSLDELISTVNVLNPSGSYRVVYKDPREYRRLAARFKLMSDIRVSRKNDFSRILTAPISLIL